MKRMLNYRTVSLAVWNMFTTSVTGFINKCIDNVVPTVTIRTNPNQKSWITGNIRIELKARATAFKERDTNLDPYKGR